MRIAVLGAGAWGCALATVLEQGGHDVSLWEVDAALATRLAATRTQAYLGIQLSPAIDVTDDLARAVQNREMVVVATPSEFVRVTVGAAARHLAGGSSSCVPRKGWRRPRA